MRQTGSVRHERQECRGIERVASRLVVLVLSAVSASACVVVPPLTVPLPERVLTPRDSSAIAYETGRRDALLMHRPRTAAMTMALAFPAGLAATRATRELIAFPTTVTALSAGGTFWAYQQTRRPVPAPSDSMRARYALEAPELWRGYRNGFRDAIEAQRRAELLRSSQAMVITTLALWLTYFAVRSPG